MLKTKASKEAE